MYLDRKMTLMKYLGTSYLGVDDDGSRAEHGLSRPIRLCWATMYSWGTLVNTVSAAFCEIQLLQQESAYTNGPARVCVYYTKEDHKKKPADSETIHERVKWFIEALKVPDGGMIVSYYELPDGKEHIVIPFLIANYWPTKLQWTPKGDYISLQYLQEGIGGYKKDRVYREIPGFYDKVRDLAKQYGWEIKEVDYSMPYQETLEILAGSNMHFSYLGSSFYLAACVGVPTVGWPYFDKAHRLGTYYDYDSKERIDVMAETGQWGKITSNTVRVLRWDDERQVVTNKPEDYITHVYDYDEVTRVFKNNLV